jgi:hypothetical protein
LQQSYEGTWGYILTHSNETNAASITHFHVLRRIDSPEKVFVLFTPLTGKKHQLRLHSAFLLGSPIVGDHRYGYPQDNAVFASVREEDHVYKDGYALHCYRVAAAGESIKFDTTADFPDGRWGDMWTEVREETAKPAFADAVRSISGAAKDIFTQPDVQQFLFNPSDWAKSIRGPIVKQEVL